MVTVGDTTDVPILLKNYSVFIDKNISKQDMFDIFLSQSLENGNGTSLSLR